MEKLRILVVDDHELIRHGIKRLIEGVTDMVVVGEAANGLEAVACGPELRPDVVLMDIAMPGMGGAEATRRLKTVQPEAKVLALTLHEDNSWLHELLVAGASGYVLKSAAATELVQAVRAISSGGTYIDPRMAAKLIGALVQSPGSRARPDATEREVDVLRRIARGFSNREISAALGVSVKTVESYKARAMEKLGLSSRVDIVQLAVERGWLRGG